MNKELQALEQNHTWQLTSLPKGKKAIGSKWVYKVKYKLDGIIDCYKAKLVAKGYHQIKGLYFKDCFFSVAKMATIHFFL